MRIVELDGVVMVVTIHGDEDQGDVMLEQHGCAWFAMCTNDATTIIEHPAFPDGVPTCERCATLAGKARQ